MDRSSNISRTRKSGQSKIVMGAIIVSVFAIVIFVVLTVTLHSEGIVTHKIKHVTEMEIVGVIKQSTNYQITTAHRWGYNFETNVSQSSYLAIAFGDTLSWDKLKELKIRF